MVCSTDCAQPLRLFLGTALLCCHASIRFGDIQRVRWSSLQLSSAGLHGTCTATKTTKQGQPFACTWHGITGREYSSSWLLHWLAELAHLSEPHSACKAPEAEPDFLFLNCSLSQLQILDIAPASYARTPTLGHAKHGSHGARMPLPIRVSRTAAAQLALPREDRLAQGHHRDSARLYSRNDTYDSLRVQRRLATQLAHGWRPCRSMARGGGAPVPEPPFSVSSTAPPEHLPTMDLHGGPWARFTSRHESMQASKAALPASSSPAVSADSDSEADAVQAYADVHGNSSEEEAKHGDESHNCQLFVCNGPWSCCHGVTEDSEQAYWASQPPQAAQLRTRCGTKLGLAATAFWIAAPANKCRRKGCA